MPELYILAGPNGAGKSSLHAWLLPEGLSCFDGDKELLEQKRNFPDIDDAQLLAYINERKFPDEKEKALASDSDFAFETNFSTTVVMETVRQFTNNGYRVNLIYVGLSSVQESIARVERRVQTGGHSVNTETIKFNYEKGLQLVSGNIEKFDRVLVLDNQGRSRISLPKVIIRVQKGKILTKSSRLPDWARQILKGPALIPRKRIANSKGRRI